MAAAPVHVHVLALLPSHRYEYVNSTVWWCSAQSNASRCKMFS
jgi:hypothetical protein